MSVSKAALLAAEAWGASGLLSERKASRRTLLIESRIAVSCGTPSCVCLPMFYTYRIPFMSHTRTHTQTDPILNNAVLEFIPLALCKTD